MKDRRQKIVFKGPLADMLYKAMEHYQGVSTESIENDARAISLVSSEAGKRLVIQKRTVSTIVVFGVVGSDVTASIAAEYLRLVAGSKSSTSVRLLLLGTPNDHARILGDACVHYDTQAYQSVDTMLQDILK